MIGQLRRIALNPKSLRDRALNAGGWTLLSFAARYPLRLGSNLILTRILMPDAFALMAVVAVTHQGLQLLSDIGLAQSVIRDKRGEEPHFLRVVWTAQIMRGACLVAALILLGIAVSHWGATLARPASVYADPRLPAMLWVSSLVIGFGSFESTCRLLALRRLLVARNTQIELVNAVSTICSSIALVYLTQSVWGMIAGLVIGGFVSLALSHIMLSGPRMSLVWDRDILGELWLFGRWLIGSSTAGFLLQNSDKLVFGALMDKTTFGVYAIATIWVEAWIAILRRVSGVVFLPALRETRDQGRSLEPPLRKLLLVIAGGALALYSFDIFIATVMMDVMYLPPINDGKVFVIILATKILLVPFQQFSHVVMLQGDTRFFAIAVLCGAVASIAGLYLALNRLGVIPAVAINVALLSLPIFMFMAHRACRIYRLTAVSALLLAALIALHLLMVWWLFGF